jgi:hypothetical protein
LHNNYLTKIEMKKLYTLSLLIASCVTFAQTPILTGIMDGDCTGGNPKVVEIYANGTVDFGAYALENQTNATTGTWGQTMNLAALGTKTNEFVYVVNGNAAEVGPVFAAEFASIPSSNVIYSGTGTGIPQPLNVNGDDRVRLINASTLAVVDQYGVSDVDGTDSAWEYLDSWAKRNNGTGPDGATFVESNWTYGGVEGTVGALEGLGTCQGAAAFSTVVPFGTFSLRVSQNSIAGLQVYPNPVANGNLYITSDANETKAVTIYDILGKKVISTTLNDQPVNVSNLNSGVYIVKVTEAGKTATRKLVIK